MKAADRAAKTVAKRAAEVIRATHTFAVSDERFRKAIDALERTAANRLQQDEDVLKSTRVPFPGSPLVQIHVPTGRAGEAPHACNFRVWGRELSRSGAHFLFAREAVALSSDDAPLLLDVRRWLKCDEEIALGFPQPDGNLLWLLSRVIHVGGAPLGLQECTVGFVKRLQS